MNDRLDELIEIPAQARRLYPRGRPDGLEAVALQVLACLVRDGQISTQSQAETLELQAATVRHALSELRRRGLISVSEDPADARRRQHHPTDSGRELVQELIKR